MGKRNYRIDNIRFILIALVVFGHLIENMNGTVAPFLYVVIYTFHMPAFIFLTGFFAKFKARRICALALAYVVFQTLYLLLDWALGASAGATLHLQYLTPRWILWYLLACTVWMLLVPLFRTTNRVRMGVTLAVSIAIAIGVGFVADIGYFLSISRILVFAPFFIAGLYARQLVGQRQERLKAAGASEEELVAGWVQGAPGVRWKLLVIGLVGVALTCVLALFGNVAPSSLYNSMAYEITGGSALLRLAAMALAACWICLLFAAVPNKRVRAVTNAGAHTMPTYLIHGLVILTMRAYAPLTVGDAAGILLALVLALAMVFAFGNKYLDKVVRFGL